MIRKLRIQGYRSLRDVTWEPGRLNVLIGPNASGKSNLLRALELLGAAREEDGIRKEIIASGGAEVLKWNREAQTIQFDLDFGPGPGNADKPEFYGAYHLGLEMDDPYGGYRIRSERLDSGIGDEDITFERGTKEFVDVPLIAIDEDGVTQIQTGKYAQTRENALLGRITGSGRLLYPADRIRSLQAELAGWALYHDVDTSTGAPMRKLAVTRYDVVLEHDARNLVTFMHTAYGEFPEFQLTIDACLKAAFSNSYDRVEFSPAGDGRILLRIKWTDSKHKPSQVDLSDGTLRLIALAAMLSNPAPESLIAIDEPEVGLHPKLLTIIAALANEAAERSQVVFATHSPDFLDQLAPYQPDVFVTEWAEGETTLKKIAGADLQEWMRDYRIGEAFRSGELEALA